MLYFFHHYELPVILQQAQFQQLLIRNHHGTLGGMMGLASIAALASGTAYHDAPGTGTQATPPTTQSTTQTIQNTVQSTTQTSPSVSSAQTNTTHTGDVVFSRNVTTETNATGTNTLLTDIDEQPVATPEPQINPVKNSISSDKGIKIKEIRRRTSSSDIQIIHNENSVSKNNAQETPDCIEPSDNTDSAESPSLSLDRRRKFKAPTTGEPILPQVTRLAPRASPEADDLI